MAIHIDGKSIATYVWQDALILRPFWKQVFAPNGKQVTRGYPTDPILNRDNDDHATFHPGMWLAFGDINGSDFWRNKATVRHIEFVESPSILDTSISFVVRNAYEFAGSVVCYETNAVAIDIIPEGYLFSTRSVFSSPADFAFGDQEEMGFGVRLATALTVRHGTGEIGNSEGGQNEEGTWGKAARWCAYSGTLDGQRTGIMLIPHEDNFRASWFHSRDYGLLVANPFGKKAMTAPRDRDVLPDQTHVNAGEMFSVGFSVLAFGNSDGDPISLESTYKNIVARLREGTHP